MIETLDHLEEKKRRSTKMPFKRLFINRGRALWRMKVSHREKSERSELKHFVILDKILELLYAPVA